MKISFWLCVAVKTQRKTLFGVEGSVGASNCVGGGNSDGDWGRQEAAKWINLFPAQPSSPPPSLG